MTGHRRGVKRRVLLVQREGYAHHLAGQHDRRRRLAEALGDLRVEVGPPDRQAGCHPTTVEEQPALFAGPSFAELAAAAVLAGVIRPRIQAGLGDCGITGALSPRCKAMRKVSTCELAVAGDRFDVGCRAFRTRHLSQCTLDQQLEPGNRAIEPREELTALAFDAA